MPFSIDRLLATDVPACVQIYFDSFQNSHSLACWLRVHTIRAFWKAMFLDEMEDPKSHFIKAVDLESGDLAAFCKWVEPKPGVFPDLNLPTWPEEADVRLCNDTFGTWAAKHRDLMQDRGHWCMCFTIDSCFATHITLTFSADLEIVGTALNYQRQGAGSMLIQYGCDRADGQGSQAFLQAAPGALRLYLRFSFCGVAETHTWIENGRLPRGELYTETFMIRQPHTE
jgi:hypothetical protein